MVDHRAAQSLVRNQDDRKTCVGFAVSAAHEWVVSDGGILSPEDAIWAGHRQGGPAYTEATTIPLALGGLTTHRHASESAWPYGSPPWPSDRPAAASDPSQQRDLPSWRELNAPDLQMIEGELVAGNAVLLSLRVVRSAWRQPGGFVDAPAGAPAREGHAVLAVGVLDDAPGERVIVKNSWGPTWGVNGYGFVTKGYLDAHLKGAFVLERV